MVLKRHTKDEISAKLAQARDLAAQGKVQNEIASAIGVSVMTLHRWRKGQTRIPRNQAPVAEAEVGNHAPIETSSNLDIEIEELKLENSRLRRLVTDLLLEKIALTEGMSNHRLPLGRIAR